MNTSRLYKASKRRRQVDLKRLFLAVMAAVIVAGFSMFAGTGLVDAHDTNEKVMCKYYKSIEITSGDTLWSIAKEHMTEEYDSVYEYIDEVMEMNNLESEQIQEGQYLTVAYYDVLEQ